MMSNIRRAVDEQFIKPMLHYAIENPKKSVSVAWLGLVAANYADYESTKYAMRRGIAEQNPGPAETIAEDGFAGFRRMKAKVLVKGGLGAVVGIALNEEMSAMQTTLSFAMLTVLTFVTALVNVVYTQYRERCR